MNSQGTDDSDDLKITGDTEDTIVQAESGASFRLAEDSDMSFDQKMKDGGWRGGIQNNDQEPVERRDTYGQI